MQVTNVGLISSDSSEVCLQIWSFNFLEKNVFKLLQNEVKEKIFFPLQNEKKNFFIHGVLRPFCSGILHPLWFTYILIYLNFEIIP